MQQTQLDTMGQLWALVGAQSERIKRLEAQIEEHQQTIVRIRDWAIKTQRRLPPPKKSRIPPENIIKAEHVERAYGIIRKYTGRNYQSDSDYGKMCKALMHKHGVDTVCQVLAFACRCNHERSADQWSKPATLFRPANFRRHMDEMVAQNG